MAILPVPNTVAIRLKGDHEGDPRITTVHYRHGGANDPVPDADLNLLAQAFINNVLPWFLDCVNQNTTYQSVSATDIGRLHGNQHTRTLTGVHGLNNLAVAPGDVNVALVKKDTAHTKGSQGRLFVPDVPIVSVVDANIDPALQALLNTLAVKLFSYLGAPAPVPYAPVVASLKHGLFYVITGVTYDLITDHLITRLKNHRRHKRKRVTPPA